MGADVKWVTDPERLRPSGSEVFRLLGSNEKIRQLTGWVPQVSLEEGLKRTINWIIAISTTLKPYGTMPLWNVFPMKTDIGI